LIFRDLAGTGVPYALPGTAPAVSLPIHIERRRCDHEDFDNILLDQRQLKIPQEPEISLNLAETAPFPAGLLRRPMGQG
jgi:hypothetical protein